MVFVKRNFQIVYNQALLFINNMVDYTTRILITGGTGSIGQAIAKRYIMAGCHQENIRLLTNDENSIFDFKATHPGSKIKLILADIRDPTRLKMAMKDVDMVFHAAAMKHVDICEENPFDAAYTNVIGTKNVIEAAIEAKVKKFILISTDKAVSADNTLGASKLLAERMVLDAPIYGETKFSVVRFGNVIGSRGSVYQIFRKRISQGYDLHVFNSSMTRFIMSMEDAARLIEVATSQMQGGEIFILKMKSVSILDLAKTMVQFFNSNSEIVVTDIHRKGEKIHESLLSPNENYHITDLGDMIKIDYKQDENTIDTDVRIFNSATAPRVTTAELYKVFKEIEDL